MKLPGRRISFVIRGPWQKGRASVSFIKVITDTATKKRDQPQVADHRIDALNEQYRAGLLKLEDHSLRIAAEQLKAEFEKEVARLRGDKPLSAFNVEILDSFIKKKILVKTSCQKTTLDTDIARATRVIKELGPHSLRTVEVDHIQNILDGQSTAINNKHFLLFFRRLLSFVGREDDAGRLRPKTYDKTMPPFVTMEQMELLVKSVPKELLSDYPALPSLIRLTFNLGTRLSESLGLKKEDVGKTKGSNVVVKIQRQWVRARDANGASDRIRLPKNKKIRTTLPLDKNQLLIDLEVWLKTHPQFEDRERYRGAIQRYIKTFCIENFALDAGDDDEGEFFFNEASLRPIDEERRYKATHMLRAGHAVEMLKRTNGNFYFVANNIGDNPEVLRQHYGGVINPGHIIDEVAKLI